MGNEYDEYSLGGDDDFEPMIPSTPSEEANSSDGVSSVNSEEDQLEFSFTSTEGSTSGSGGGMNAPSMNQQNVQAQGRTAQTSNDGVVNVHSGGKKIPKSMRNKQPESSRTESASMAVNNGVNKNVQQAQPMRKKSGALPDPNQQTRVPQRKANAQQNGAGQIRNMTPQQKKAMQNQQRVQQMPPQQGQVPNSNQQVQNGKKQKPQKPPKKKGGKGKKIIVALVIVGALAGGGAVAYKMMVPVAQEYDYSTSGRKVYDDLQGVINSYEPEAVDSFIGAENGDSYLAQEWSYANKNETRENFIKKVCSMVQFSYPQVEQLSTKGQVMTDKSGNPIMMESYMNNGENVIITLPDYKAIAEQMDKDRDLIDDMSIMEDIRDTDYDYQDECFDLMIKYILQLDEIPTVSKEVSISISGGKVSDDTELDNILFASDDYHEMCDMFDKIMTGFTGVTTEKYTEKEEVHNPEYDEWYKIFKERYDADGGVFNKNTSLWEPWYVYNEKNELQYDENGNKLVRYYSVKDENGNDWIQPSKTILQDVEKTREVPVEYVPEKAVPYCYLGAYYAQNVYDGEVPSDVRVGDGTVAHPAGVGTPIITKVLGTDGKYHDIKVTLKGYWVGQDAIDYAVTFSEKNRGFDPNSPVQLICYEVEVYNLEDKDFTFDSEMMLCDKSASKTGRTGTMYGFNYEGVTVKSKDSVIFNDWATSTELEQKYVAWGKSFNRQYEPVFFKVLAGTGEVPTYSAYTEFTGNSTIEEEAELEEQMNGLDSGASAEGTTDGTEGETSSGEGTAEGTEGTEGAETAE